MKNIYLIKLLVLAYLLLPTLGFSETSDLDQRIEQKAKQNQSAQYNAQKLAKKKSKSLGDKKSRSRQEMQQLTTVPHQNQSAPHVQQIEPGGSAAASASVNNKTDGQSQKTEKKFLGHGHH